MHVWVWHLFVFDTWYHLCMHVLHTCSCIYQHVYYILEAHKIISRFLHLCAQWKDLGFVFCFSIFCVLFPFRSARGSSPPFYPRTKVKDSPTTTPPTPPPVTQQGQKAKASPALQPQRWTWTPRGTTGRPAGTWAVVSHRVRQRVRMLNAIWPCHSLGEAGRESGERVKVKSRKTVRERWGEITQR